MNTRHHRDEQPDHVHVHAEVVGQSGADPGDDAVVPVPHEYLAVVDIAHNVIIPHCRSSTPAKHGCRAVRLRLPAPASANPHPHTLAAEQAERTAPCPAPPSQSAADLLKIDDELSDEERLVRDTVRKFAADRIMPHIADWFEAGTLPTDLVPELGQLGLLGMHLKGYGCAGMGPIAYGVTCREMEAADSGLRSLVSVQGSLAMFPIWKYGSEDQKNEWLPRMAAGQAIGCFGLTEPDHGSDPSSMKTRAVKNGSDWVLSGSKMWITNGSIADVAVVWARTEEGIRGFVVPRGARGFTARNIHKKLSLRASITSELHFDDVRLPATPSCLA